MNTTLPAPFDLASYQSKLTGVVNGMGQPFKDAVINSEPFEEYELPVGNYRIRLQTHLESNPLECLDVTQEHSNAKGYDYVKIDAPFKITQAKPKDGNPSDYLGVEFVKRIALIPYTVKATGVKKLMWVDKLKTAVQLCHGEYPSDDQVIAAFTIGCLGAEWDIVSEPRTDNPNKNDWRFIGCPVKPQGK